MSPLDTFLYPGSTLLDLVFGNALRALPPEIVTLLAGLLSWLVWAGLLRITWAITQRFFGFGRGGRY